MHNAILYLWSASQSPFLRSPFPALPSSSGSRSGTELANSLALTYTIRTGIRLLLPRGSMLHWESRTAFLSGHFQSISSQIGDPYRVYIFPHVPEIALLNPQSSLWSTTSQYVQHQLGDWQVLVRTFNLLPWCPGIPIPTGQPCSTLLSSRA